MKTEKSDHDKGDETKEDKSSDGEEEFLGFSPPSDKVSFITLRVMSSMWTIIANGISVKQVSSKIFSLRSCLE